MKQPTFSFVLACYNERENISILVPRILDGFKGEALEIIFVDDGSTDGTLALIDELAARYPFITAIRRQKLMCIGSALKAGFDRARGVYCISFDCDLPIPIEDARKVAATIRTGRFDLVLGSRYLHDSFYEAPNHGILKKKLVSRCANLFFKIANFINLSDFTFNCRGMKREVWPLIRPESDNNFMLFEMVWRAHHRKLSIGEVPVRFFDRRLGSSKLVLGSEMRRCMKQFFALRRKYFLKRLSDPVFQSRD